MRPTWVTAAYLSRLLSLLITHHWTHSHSEFCQAFVHWVSSPASRPLHAGWPLPETLLPLPTSSVPLLLSVTSSKKGLSLSPRWWERSSVPWAPIAPHTICDAFVIMLESCPWLRLSVPHESVNMWRQPLSCLLVHFSAPNIATGTKKYLSSQKCLLNKCLGSEVPLETVFKTFCLYTFFRLCHC